MNCLIDYIGLVGCNEVTPDSGLYVNQLPGISIELMDNIATADQTTYKQIWKDAQELAWRYFTKAFFAELLKCYTVDKNCDYENLICINKEKLVDPWRYLCAYQLMFFRRYSNRLNYYTTITLEDAEKLMLEFQKQFKSTLILSMQQIDVSTCHLHCGGDPEVVTWLP